MTKINVQADIMYPVEVGHGTIRRLANFLGDSDRVAIIHPENLATTGEALRASLANVHAVTIQVPDAESAKSAKVLQFCWEALGREGFTRNDTVVSLGGGATTDLAGFVAASWLRGVRLIHIPTTLLAMVDAAIGGKTGINTSSGKNLVGAFYSPSAVLCDLDFLTTQSTADYIGGLAEIIKAGFIRDPRILELIETDPVGAQSPYWKHTEEIISRAIQVKAGVVGVDLKETLGTDVGREILNYGHTFAHAIERCEHYEWRHGNAVAVGMVFVAELAHLDGWMSRELRDRHRRILKSVGLPTSYSTGKWDDLLAAMRIDKKARGDQLRFVILRDVATPAILAGPDTALLFAAYREIVNP